MFSGLVQWFHVGVAGLWPLIWKFGVSGVIVIACVAAYVFTPAPLLKLFPNIKKVLLGIAGAVVLITVSYAVGVADEHNRGVAQERIATSWAYNEGQKAAEYARQTVKARRAAGAHPKRGWVRKFGTHKPDRYDRSPKR